MFRSFASWTIQFESAFQVKTVWAGQVLFCQCIWLSCCHQIGDFVCGRILQWFQIQKCNAHLQPSSFPENSVQSSVHSFQAADALNTLHVGRIFLCLSNTATFVCWQCEHEGELHNGKLSNLPPWHGTHGVLVGVECFFDAEKQQCKKTEIAAHNWDTCGDRKMWPFWMFEIFSFSQWWSQKINSWKTLCACSSCLSKTDKGVHGDKKMCCNLTHATKSNNHFLTSTSDSNFGNPNIMSLPNVSKPNLDTQKRPCQGRSCSHHPIASHIDPTTRSRGLWSADSLAMTPTHNFSQAQSYNGEHWISKLSSGSSTEGSQCPQHTIRFNVFKFSKQTICAAPLFVLVASALDCEMVPCGPDDLSTANQSSSGWQFVPCGFEAVLRSCGSTWSRVST